MVIVYAYSSPLGTPHTHKPRNVTYLCPLLSEFEQDTGIAMCQGVEMSCWDSELPNVRDLYGIGQH